MSKTSIVHSALIRMQSSLHSAEGSGFIVKSNFDDLSDSDIKALRSYVYDIQETVNSLKFLTEFISLCFTPVDHDVFKDEKICR